MGQGETTNTLDAKGRLAIPPGMRMELLGSDNRPPVLTRLLEAPALGLYPAVRWDEFRRRLDSLSQVKTSVQRVRRHVVGGAKEAPIDGQGRLLIPPHLREYADLEREVTILDTGTRFEIWDRARHREELQTIRLQGQQLADEVGDLGL
jgi:MraZ protein